MHAQQLQMSGYENVSPEASYSRGEDSLGASSNPLDRYQNCTVDMVKSSLQSPIALTQATIKKLNKDQQRHEKTPLKQSQFHMFGIAPDETVVEDDTHSSRPKMLGD